MVELHCHSCYSFLDGASFPEELVARAVELGYRALALTDHNGLYGSMEFAQAAAGAGLQAITGAEVTLEDESHLVLLAENPEGYANLCRLLTLAHRTGERRFPRLPVAALAAHARGLIALSGCPRGQVPQRLMAGRREEAARLAERYREWFADTGAGPCFYLEAQQNLARGDTERLRMLAELSRSTGIPLVATNNTHYHKRERHRLQDTMVAIRCGCTLDEAHPHRRPNSEFALKRPETLRARFREHPEALRNALAIAERCRAFDITTDLGYVFPDFEDEDAAHSQGDGAHHGDGFHHGDTEGTERDGVGNTKRDGAWGGKRPAIPSHGRLTRVLTAPPTPNPQPPTPNPSPLPESRNPKSEIRNSPKDPDLALRRLCEQALTAKYAQSPPELREEAGRWLEEELRLTRLHGLAGFFLVYRDLLQLSKQVAAEIRGAGPRGRFEMPPGRGRGSAVSSIICYLIGLSPVDPVKARLFPGRFLNECLTTVPDIDIDFPRDIRAELIKRVHQRYGEDHVAMVCILPTYRFRGAVREVGKALGLPAAELDRLAKVGDGRTPVDEEMDRLSEFARLGENRLWGHLRELSRELWGMPRHLSQHVGGVLISSRPLCEIVPIERSAMDGRQLVQWDKDSCDAARMIKIDFLALGMLSAVEECLELIVANGKPAVDLSRIPFTDRKVYDRICRGETIGAFQIESRAQIGMLVRTLPRNVEDLAVQVAIVRPGPIVGNAVNPYVRNRELMRKNRRYEPPMDHPLLAPVLGDTLGVIIYQDQVMEVCKALAGFTDGEADQLRRAMSRKRSRAALEGFRDKFMSGAAARGVKDEVACRMFEKVVAFSEFGFPKSHAAAFAILAYQSMWLLHYHPAEFVASILNNEPMGFYAPDTLVKDFQRRGVVFLAPHLNESALGCTVSARTVRLGLKFVSGLGDDRAREILAERQRGGPFRSLPDFLRRTREGDRVTERLILIGAMDSFGLNRRELLWQLGLQIGARDAAPEPRTSEPRAPEPRAPEPRAPEPRAQRPLRQLTLLLPTEQDQVELLPAGAWERMAHDYRYLGMSADGHPVGLVRRLLSPEILPIRRLREVPEGATVRVAGLVTCRQRPGTAKGILFLLLEDETGMVNAVVRPELYDSARETFRAEPLLVLEGTVERRTRRINLLAISAAPITEYLPDAVKSSAARRAHQAIEELDTPRGHNFR